MIKSDTDTTYVIASLNSLTALTSLTFSTLYSLTDYTDDCSGAELCTARTTHQVQRYLSVSVFYAAVLVRLLTVAALMHAG